MCFSEPLHVGEGVFVIVEEPARIDRRPALAIDQLRGKQRAVEPFQRVSRLAGQMHNPTAATVRGIAGMPIVHIECARVCRHRLVDLGVDVLDNWRGWHARSSSGD